MNKKLYKAIGTDGNVILMSNYLRSLAFDLGRLVGYGIITADQVSHIETETSLYGY